MTIDKYLKRIAGNAKRPLRLYTISYRESTKMNTNELRKTLFWQLAEEELNPQNVALAWNAFFGKDYENLQQRLNAFIKEARNFNNAEFQAHRL